MRRYFKIDSQQEMWVSYDNKKCVFHCTSLGKCPHALVVEWWGEGHTSRCQSPHGRQAQSRCFFQLSGRWSCGQQVCSASARWTADSQQKTQRTSCETLGWGEARRGCLVNSENRSVLFTGEKINHKRKVEWCFLSSNIHHKNAWGGKQNKTATHKGLR